MKRNPGAFGSAIIAVTTEWQFALRAHSDLVARYGTAPEHEMAALRRLLRASDLRLATEIFVALGIGSDVAESLAAFWFGGDQ